MLNALRHQWFGRILPWVLVAKFKSAQRLAASVVWQEVSQGRGIHFNPVLNALRHQWFGRRLWPSYTWLSLECSTPCGISGLAGFPNQGERILSIVLNALRHQWFGRDGPTFQGALGNLVLNALRHQWFGRGCDAGHGTRTRCVLNALRHQWFGSVGLVENARPPASAQRLAASVVWQGISNVLLTDGTEGAQTPCGISGLADASQPQFPNACTSAQRLAASVVWQRFLLRCLVPRNVVLNALRHQWFGSASLQSPAPSDVGAQRLAASVVWQSRHVHSPTP